jgi:EamA domain-containing membrane protein RarD
MTSTIRALIAAWAALMALSLALAFAGDVVHTSRLGAVGIAMVALAAAFKAYLVLRCYLGLKAAPGALSGFSGVVVVTLALVAASFLFFSTPSTKSHGQSAGLTFVKDHSSAAF